MGKNVAAKPRISIVIPCYNEESFLSKTLDSLKDQNYSKQYEIIVVDNNSTDKTVAIANKHKVRVVKAAQAGVCHARQAGTLAANGEIVISTDADTVFSKDWLSTIDSHFKKNKDCIAVTGPCRYINGPWWGKLYPIILFRGVNLYSKIIGRPFYVTATNIAFLKSAWEGYDTTLNQGGDELGLLHSLQKKGKVVFVYNNPVYTSARRLTRGLFYNLFVTFLIYYLLAYYINKLLKRTVIGSYPAFREMKQNTTNRLTIISAMAVVLLSLAYIHLPKHENLLEQGKETLMTASRHIK